MKATLSFLKFWISIFWKWFYEVLHSPVITALLSIALFITILHSCNDEKLHRNIIKDELAINTDTLRAKLISDLNLSDSTCIEKLKEYNSKQLELLLLILNKEDQIIKELSK